MGPILEPQRDVPAARELDDLLDARVLAAARNDSAIERAACFEGFADSVNSRQAVHKEDSLQARMLSGKQRREQIQHKKRSIQRGAEFEDAGARGLDGHGERKRRCII